MNALLRSRHTSASTQRPDRKVSAPTPMKWSPFRGIRRHLGEAKQCAPISLGVSIRSVFHWDAQPPAPRQVPERPKGEDKRKTKFGERSRVRRVLLSSQLT